MESVRFQTEDGVEIAADWYPVEGATWFVLLMHMRPATKESWHAWVAALNAKGFACLAFDQRGHGGSTMHGEIVLDELGEKEGPGKILDLQAAWRWLKTQGVSEETCVLIGASIGANLAIRFAAEHYGISHVIALSPGLNFRGVTTNDAIMHLAHNQRVLLVASNDDPVSWEAVHALHDLNPERTIVLEQHGLGHGTHMTDADPVLLQTLLTHLP